MLVLCHGGNADQIARLPWVLRLVVHVMPVPGYHVQQLLGDVAVLAGALARVDPVFGNVEILPMQPSPVVDVVAQLSLTSVLESAVDRLEDPRAVVALSLLDPEEVDEVVILRLCCVEPLAPEASREHVLTPGVRTFGHPELALQAQQALGDPVAQPLTLVVSQLLNFAGEPLRLEVLGPKQTQHVPESALWDPRPKSLVPSRNLVRRVGRHKEHVLGAG